MRRRIHVFLSFILSTSVLANVSVYAIHSNMVTADNPRYEPSLLQIANERAKIAQVNSDILFLKTRGTELVGEITADLQAAPDGSLIKNGKSYSEIVNAMAGLTANLKEAESIDYRTALKNADAKKGAECAKALTINVEPMLEQKKRLLTSAVATLRQAAVQAEILSGRSGSGSSCSSSGSAVRRSMVDTNSREIAQAYDSCRGLISQIIATIAANQDMLSAQQVEPMENSLSSISKTLSRVKNNGLSQANRSFLHNQKSGDFVRAESDLNNIITIQQNRLNTLCQVENQLQKILSRVNALLDTSSPPSGSTAA